MKTYFEIVAESVMEKYSPDNRYFLDYMKSGADPYPLWYEICDWLEQSDNLDLVNELLGPGKEVADAESMRETVEPDFFYELPQHIQTDAIRAATDQMMRYDPASTPTSAHMSLERDSLLKRTTWLIHYSNNAHEIALNGFKYGMDQMDKLGLTTYWAKEAKKGGGYNFAFEAGSRYAENGAGRYGNEAVMFMNSGVKCHHYSDEEEQIVFWGADVDPRDIVYLACESGTWKIENKKTGRALFENDDVGKVIKWVIQNFTQYRRAMGCR